MKVLFITNHYMTGNSGGTFATRAFVNAFAELSKKCVFVYPDRSGEDPQVDLRCELRPTLDNRGKPQKLWDLWCGRIHRYSKVFKSLLLEVEPDLVVFDNSRCSAGLMKQAQMFGVHVIVIHHNCEREYYRDELRWQNEILRRWFMDAFLAYHVRKAEKKAVLLSDLNITLTAADIETLQSYYDPQGRMRYACIGCFESEKRNPSKSFTERSSADLMFVITGNLSAIQTRNSLQDFIERYIPHLSRMAGFGGLVVAGRNPSAELIEVCSQFGIRVIPNPENMDDMLRTVDIYICPADSGGGIKLRIMDGLRNGLPVVAHDCAARGYEEFYDAGFLFKYSNTFEFSHAITQAISLAGSKRDEIIKMYMARFGFQSGVSRVKDVILKNLSNFSCGDV